MVVISEPQDTEEQTEKEKHGGVKEQENPKVIDYLLNHDHNRGQARKDPQEEECLHRDVDDHEAHDDPALDLVWAYHHLHVDVDQGQDDINYVCIVPETHEVRFGSNFVQLEELIEGWVCHSNS